MDDQTEKFVMNTIDWRDWFHNAKLFLAPVIIMYLTGVTGILMTDGHVFSIEDLYITKFMQGGIVLYLLNSTLDWVRKWTREVK